MPIKGDFIGEPMTKRVDAHGGVKVNHAHAVKKPSEIVGGVEVLNVGFEGREAQCVRILIRDPVANERRADRIALGGHVFLGLDMAVTAWSHLGQHNEHWPDGVDGCELGGEGDAVEGGVLGLGGDLAEVEEGDGADAEKLHGGGFGDGDGVGGIVPSTNSARRVTAQSFALAPHAHVVKVEAREWSIDVI